MGKLAKYFRIYIRFVSQYLKSLIEYRMDFAVGIFSFLLTQFSGIMFLYLVFNHIPQLNGWGFNELLLIYAFFQIPRGIDHLLTDNLWLLGIYIIKGDFDKYLLRPINPLFHLLAEKFQFDAIGELIVGISLLIYVSPKLDIALAPLDYFYVLIFVVIGTIIYTTIKLIMISWSFWIKDSKAILYAVYDFAGFAKYPIAIYPKFLRVIVAYIIPFAFTSYFPSAFILGKVGSGMLIFQGIMVASALCVISYTIWLRGLKRYESAGS